MNVCGLINTFLTATFETSIAIWESHFSNRARSGEYKFSRVPERIIQDESARVIFILSMYKSKCRYDLRFLIKSGFEIFFSRKINRESRTFWARATRARARLIFQPKKKKRNSIRNVYFWLFLAAHEFSSALIFVKLFEPTDRRLGITSWARLRWANIYFFHLRIR